MQSRLEGLSKDLEEGESTGLASMEDVVKFLKDGRLALSSQDVPQHVGCLLMVPCRFLSCQRFEMVVAMLLGFVFSTAVVDPSLAEVE